MTTDNQPEQLSFDSQGQPESAPRKRGGQPGNQNARTHGYYSDTVLPDIHSKLREAASLRTLHGELALMRVKLASLLADPDVDPELVIKAVRTIARLVEIHERFWLYDK